MQERLCHGTFDIPTDIHDTQGSAIPSCLSRHVGATTSLSWAQVCCTSCSQVFLPRHDKLTGVLSLVIVPG